MIFKKKVLTDTIRFEIMLDTCPCLSPGPENQSDRFPLFRKSFHQASTKKMFFFFFSLSLALNAGFIQRDKKEGKSDKFEPLDRIKDIDLWLARFSVLSKGCEISLYGSYSRVARVSEQSRRCSREKILKSRKANFFFSRVKTMNLIRFINRS